MLPYILLFFVLGLLLAVSIKFNLYALLTITVCLLSGAICVIVALYLIYVIRICGTSMFGKQGYLTFSIPISYHSLILSKILTVLIYMFGFTVTLYLTVFLCITILSPENIANISNSFLHDIILLGEHPDLSVVNILYNLLTTVTSIITLIFAFTLANCGIARNKRTFLAVVFFFGINIVFSIFNAFDPVKLYVGYDLINYCFVLYDANYIDEFSKVFGIWELILNIIQCLSLYIGTIYLLNNKIELE